jgi:hypothetical protein
MHLPPGPSAIVLSRLVASVVTHDSQHTRLGALCIQETQWLPTHLCFAFILILTPRNGHRWYSQILTILECPSRRSIRKRLHSLLRCTVPPANFWNRWYPLGLLRAVSRCYLLVNVYLISLSAHTQRRDHGTLRLAPHIPKKIEVSVAGSQPIPEHASGY